MKIKLTEFSSPTGRLCKTYTFDSTGKYTEQKAPNIAQATAVSVELDMNKVADYLDTLTSEHEKCVVLGACKFGDGPFEVVKDAQRSGDQIARTQEFFDWANSGSVSLILLDFDSEKYPEETRRKFLYELNQELQDALVGETAHEISQFAYWSRPSSSSSVEIKGKEKKGLHVFLPVKHCNNDIIKLIHQYAWLKFNGTHKIEKSGNITPVSLIDPKVGTPERIVYTSDVLCFGSGEFFTHVERKCQYFPGGVIDGEVAVHLLRQLTIDFSTSWNQIKSTVERSSEAREIKRQFVKEQTEKLGNKTSALALSSFQLTSNMELKRVRDTPIRVRDILLNPEDYLGLKGFNDPISEESDRNVGMIIGNDKTQYLKSFAHGEVKYKLVWNYEDLKEWVENADEEEILSLFPNFISNCFCEELQEDALIKVAAKRGKVTTSVVRKSSQNYKDNRTEEESDTEIYLDKEATHREIVDNFIYRAGDAKIFGNLYVWKDGGDIWETWSKPYIEKKIGHDYKNVRLCKTTPHYEQLARLVMKDEAITTEAWPEEIGFPCSDGFWKVDKEKGIYKVPYTREMLCRYKMKIKPDFSNKPMPEFGKVLRNVTGEGRYGNMGANDILFQQLFGLALCGMLPKMQKIVMFFGTGGAGKGTTHDIIKAMLPKKRVTNLMLEQFTKHDYVIKLWDSKINFTPELSKRKTPELQQLYAMVGRGDIAARDLYASSMEFKSNCGFLISTNFWFKLETTGSETERRFADTIVEFVKNSEESDIELAEKIINRELPLVLAWAMRGVEMYLKEGLANGHSRELYSKWLSSVDAFTIFVEEHFTKKATSRDSVLRGEVWKKYCDFCERTGYFRMQKGFFFDAIRGLPHVREDKSGEFKFFGLRWL